MKLKKKQMSKKEKEIPAKLPIVDTGKGEPSSQDHVPKPIPPVAVDKSDKPSPSNGHIVGLSSPIRKLKIPKIKREVTEIKNEKETVNTPYNTMRNELEKDVLSEETGTDVENELNLESKRKRKLPAKYSNAFEVTLNKSNTPQKSNQPVSPKKAKFSTKPTASPLSQRTPSNTPKSESKSIPMSNPPKLGSSLGGVTQIERIGGKGGGGVGGEAGLDKKPVGGMSSPGRFGHIKTEASSPKHVVQDNVIYRCPLHPCTWTCGKEGMRQGPAVLHLLRVHKIQPLAMRERGIKFDKIYT